MRHKIVSGVLALMVIGMLANAGEGETETALAAAPGESKAAAGSTKPGGAEKAETAPEMTAQDKFFEIVDEGADAADEADNELLVVKARKTRAAALCDLLPSSLEVSGWTGTVEDVSTELGGDKGVLSIDIGSDVAVTTWNNSLSDIGSRTLIAPSSPMYDVMAGLSEGDEVSFDGSFVRDGDTCLQEQSLMDESGMLTPDFSFKFDSVTKN